MAQRGYREAQERAALAHDIALTLQRSLLPADLPVPPGLELAVRYLPAGSRSVMIANLWTPERLTRSMTWMTSPWGTALSAAMIACS